MDSIALGYCVRVGRAIARVERTGENGWLCMELGMEVFEYVCSSGFVPVIVMLNYFDKDVLCMSLSNLAKGRWSILQNR